MKSNFAFDTETLLSIKQSHPDFYRLLRMHEVDERPYHETLDKEKFKREADMGLHNVDDYFGKKAILDAVESFEGEKSIKTTMRDAPKITRKKTASVGATEVLTKYYYVGMLGEIWEEDHKKYLINIQKECSQLVIGNHIICYRHSLIEVEDVEKAFHEYSGVKFTDIPKQYYYVSAYDDEVLSRTLQDYQNCFSKDLETSQIIRGNKVFSYLNTVLNLDEANKKIDAFLESNDTRDNLQLAP